MNIVRRIYSLAKCLPMDEKYGLRSQICRAAVSIPSNIAEGAGRSSRKDYAYFLQVALSSAFELETQLLISKDLNIVPASKVDAIVPFLLNEQKMLGALISRLQNYGIRETSGAYSTDSQKPGTKDQRPRAIPS
jgi:four helix bundle protein